MSQAPMAPRYAETPEAKKQREAEYRGFGQIFNDPALNQASTDLAGTTGYDNALNMMALGKEQAVPYGGKKSWLAAANEGLKQGIGMFNFINTQKMKQQAIAEQLRRYKEMYPDQTPQAMGAAPSKVVDSNYAAGDANTLPLA